MNKTKPILLIAVFLILTGNAVAHVALDYPAGGETFQGNEVVVIQWHVVVPHGEANWDLFFSPDGGSTWETIVLDLPQEQLNYNWTVPNISTASGQINVVQDNVSGLDYSDASGNFTISMTTGIDESLGQVENFVLFAAYPNPFNPITTISYDLQKNSNVVLKISNILGQEVRTLIDEYQTIGKKAVIWDGRNSFGQQASSGVYIYQIRAGNSVQKRRMILLR